MRRIRRLAALCACAALCCAGWTARAEGPAVPSTSQYVLGLARLAAQEAAGRRVEAVLSFAPSALAVPNKGASQALSALLRAASVSYGRQRTPTGAEQTLALTLDGAALLRVTHSTDGGASRWHSPQLARPIAAPDTLDLWGALFPGAGAGAGLAFTDAPLGIALPGMEALMPLLDRLAQSGETPLVLDAPAVDALVQNWFAAMARQLRLEADLPWRAADALTLTPTPDAQGAWKKLRIQAAFALPGEEPWRADITLERTRGDKRAVVKAEGSVTQDKQDTLQITASWTVTADKAQLSRDIRLTVRGKLNSYNAEMTLRARGSNAYAARENSLREQIKESVTVRWRVREPNWVLAGLGEGALDWSHKGTLTSGEAADAPVRGEGTASISLSRGGKVLFAGDLPWRFATGAPRAQAADAQAAPLVIAALGETERALLRAQGEAVLAGMLPQLFAVWDEKALEALRLGP